MGKDMSLQPESLGALFDMSRDPVLGIDEGQTIVFANPKAASLLGARVGMAASDLLPEHILSDPAEQFIVTLRLGEKRANVSVQRLEGVTVCTYFLLQSDAVVPGSVRAMQAMSAQLMTARLAMDALTSHIKADSDPVLQDASAALYKQYYLMRRSCLHMGQAAGILQNELPFSPRVTDLGTVCRELCETVSVLSESMGVSVTFRADFSIYLTMADRDLIEEMLANLLSNSLRHCKAGDAVQVELTRQGDRFILSVSDNGSGISADRLAGVFTDTPSGEQTDPADGAGLGLFVARGIAERHGGNMILESRPGKGTCVRVSIPCKKSDTLQMKTPLAPYRTDGMNLVLTELADVLDKKYFTKKFFD